MFRFGFENVQNGRTTVGRLKRSKVVAGRVGRRWEHLPPDGFGKIYSYGAVALENG